MTVGILPFAPRSSEVARMAYIAGREVIIHQPMQPGPDNPNLEAETLTLGMPGDDFDQMLALALERVPNAMGLSNHQGSALTQNNTSMHKLMTYVGSQGLYFLDSRTTHLTIAQDVARALNVPTTRRDVFLDHDPSVKRMHYEFDRALGIARRKGQAVLIAHPHRNSLNLLDERLQALPGDISLVRVSALVRSDSADPDPENQPAPISRIDPAVLARPQNPVSLHRLPAR
jgi:polysaccharide deacetylase 2 family uncharacterized protein YibQ